MLDHFPPYLTNENVFKGIFRMYVPTYFSIIEYSTENVADKTPVSAGRLKSPFASHLYVGTVIGMLLFGLVKIYHTFSVRDHHGVSASMRNNRPIVFYLHTYECVCRSLEFSFFYFIFLVNSFVAR